MTFWISAILLAFLAGSIPSGLLIARARGIDIRKHGSGNIGATNVGRVLGPKAWLQCFSADLLKGFVPTLTAGMLAGLAGRIHMPLDQAMWWLGVMFAPILGHMFCPWLRFKGGKGVATGLGSVLGVFPALTIPGAVAFTVFVCVLAAKRYVSLASIVGACTLPVTTLALFTISNRQHWLLEGTDVDSAGPWPFVGLTGIVAILVVVKHRANLARILAGTEPKLGDRKHRAGR
ncbi:MAG: glycerol-3-phosphate 1-O-acyltransferase PlsY [Planctomycetota bacterium]